MCRAASVVKNLEREHGLVIVQKRLAHPHNDHVGEALRSDVAGDNEDLLGDLARLQVAFDAQGTRGTERAAHRTTDLGRYADRPPAALGDHDRFYEMAVVGLEEILASTVPTPPDTGELENGSRDLRRKRGTQAFRERGGLLPVPHQAPTDGPVGLLEPIGRLAPVL